ncbi:hypothetical protein Poli38472_007806 [Pythium oligandrum]|uniref:Elicitin-like protein n=1 Tax=Pythium oligandrum TaxID=41045 RepID=A0A8K1CRX4_PYTOL|nr:hypothetical protein Poli38472_007806 [Pythium oligandrum]|eukprot:TMW68134.1 hypothetical protein Poli38472_007806 [Pythium oligandrum]
MHFTKIATLALALAVTVNAADPASCTTADEMKIEELAKSTGVDKACGISSILETTDSLSCKSKCLDAVTKLSDQVPDCSMGFMNAKDTLRVVVQMCKNEVEEGLSSTSGSQDGTAECTDAQAEESNKLAQTPEYIAACGNTTVEAANSNVCSDQKCLSYVKNKFVKQLPDCSVIGINIKTAVKMAIAMCEVVPEAGGSAPAPSGASAYIMASAASLATVALAALTVA